MDDLSLSPQFQRQLELEQLYNKNQLMPRIRQVFTDNETVMSFLQQLGVSQRFAIDALAQMALRRRVDLPTLVSLTRHHFEPDEDASQQAADTLLRLANADLFDWSPNLQTFIVKITLSQQVQDELDRYQFPLPMVVQPEVIQHNKQTGYLTSGGSIILKKNHHEEDVCLDHINRLNAIQFTLDFDTATMVRNRWKGLDKKKEDETYEDFEKRKRQFDKYNRTAQEVMAKVTEHGAFYMTHAYDKRGRSYCRGYHVNYQGNPWNKAVIQLADKEIIDDG